MRQVVSCNCKSGNMALRQTSSDSTSIDYPKIKEAIFRVPIMLKCLQSLDFKARPTDVFIATPPKCGTTWMQQIVHQLRTGGDMDFYSIHQEIPRIEFALDVGIDLQQKGKVEPRAFRTHCLYDALPKHAKYIVVLRNPCSAAYSYYEFARGSIMPDNIPLNKFVTEVWLNFGVPPNEEIPWDVSYFTFLLNWLNHKDDPNFLILFYEEMKEDLEKVVRAIALFLGISDEAKIRTAVHWSTFEFMHANKDKFDIKKQDFTGLKKPLLMVRKGSATEAFKILSDESKEAIQKRWQSEITETTGYQTYEDLRRGIREECPLKN